MELAWQGGAGFGPTPTIVDPGDEHGVGCLRMIAVPGAHPLRELIEEGTFPRRLTYRVLDPGWPSYPVRWHRGTITFDPRPNNGTCVTWTVTFDPLVVGRWPATWLTQAVMRRYAARLVRAVHDEDSTSDVGGG
jgi:hypothetical protein